METEIIEVLNIKLIPDLVNIINDYTLTPFEYYNLIDNKKYTHQEYQEYRDQYEKNISKQILGKYRSENIYKVIKDNIKNDADINKFISEKNNMFIFEKQQIHYNIEYKYVKYINDIFLRYLKLLVEAFKDARVFNVKEFKKISDSEYYIYGKQYFQYFYQGSSTDGLRIKYKKFKYNAVSLSNLVIDQLSLSGYVETEGYLSRIMESELWYTYKTILTDNLDSIEVTKNKLSKIYKI